MDQQTLQQLHGASDLTTDTVDATVAAIGETHQALAQQPYAVLTAMKSVVGDVTEIEQMQRTITRSVYRTIRAINQVAGRVATHLWNRLEK